MGFNWFVPHRKDKIGRGRRLLTRLGPSWLASPIRRVVQTLCLGVFLWLVFFVCWPYTAERARTWSGWVPVDVDTSTGLVKVAAEQDAAETPPVGMLVYPVDPTAVGQESLGGFRVTQARDRELVLQPNEAPAPELIDRLTMSFGPWLLHERDPEGWPSHYADDLASKQLVPAESFLALDPVLSVSTAVASRTWIRTLNWTVLLLLVCLLIPRGFCGYLCPLGTLIDLFDWLVGKRVRQFRLPNKGWWVDLRYYLLLATLVSVLFGVVITGFLAAIPVITRGLVFLVRPFQTAAERGWHQVPPITLGQWFSIGLFAGVFLLSLLGRRFWCRCVCPTGAVFSIANLFRLNERKVTSHCIECGRCIKACSLDAIQDDFSTRGTDCAFCQTCGGVCPVGAVQFGPRRQQAEIPPTPAPEAASVIPRRSFLTNTVGLSLGAAGGIASTFAVRAATPSDRDIGHGTPPVRPPGSVPEEAFLRMCVRCGQCLQACPNDVLQPSSFEGGLDRLWTPQVVANWSGCEPSCNNCGQVCPTGAIRALPLEEKRVARMGLAVVDEKACLPYAGQGDCQLCVDECTVAGYRAIEFIRVGTEIDSEGRPIAESGFLAPVVLPERCVGCGLCQVRCLGINVTKKRWLSRSAVVVQAGKGKEDRLRTGSYIALREAEKRKRQQNQRDLQRHEASGSDYLPTFLK